MAFDTHCGHDPNFRTSGETVYCRACEFEGRIRALEVERDRLAKELKRYTHPAPLPSKEEVVCDDCGLAIGTVGHAERCLGYRE